MTLPDAGKATSTTPSPVTIPAGRSLTIPFTPAQVQQELTSQMPIATVVEHNTAPVQYDNKISELLPVPKG